MKLPLFLLNILQIRDTSAVQKIRDKLLRVLLYFASVIGGLVYIFALIPVVKEKLIGAILFYSLFYLILVGIAFIPGLSYQIRAFSWILILFFLAINNLTYSGLNVDAGLFFISHVIMTALLLDMRRAIISLFMSLLSIAAAGFLIVGGDGNFVLGLPQTDPVLWLVGGTIFLVMGLVSAISVGALINGLVDNLKKVEKISSTLTERTKVVLERELNYRVLFETSPDVIIRFGLNGNIDAVNLAGEKLLGLPQNKILGMRVDDFIQTDDQSLARQVFEKALREGLVRDAELRIRSFSGVIVFVEFSLAQILDAMNQTVGLIAVGKDVSERKLISEIAREQGEKIIKTQNQLRDLARRLIYAQENERRIISRELHDDAGQVLVILQHSLSIALEEYEKVQYEGNIKKQLEKTIDLAKQAASIVRSSSHRLRPPALAVGGLVVSLDELCQEISSQTHLKIELIGEPINDISDDLAISLYRFVQEALTNVIKHSNANNVTVRVYQESRKIFVSVKDDGQDPAEMEEQQERYSGIGLLGLEERLALFQGKIVIDSNKKHGFAITAIIPLDKNISGFA